MADHHLVQVNPAPVGDVQFDGVSHFPSYAEKRQHCRNCPDGFTFVLCQKCNMHLCLNKNRSTFCDSLLVTINIRNIKNFMKEKVVRSW